MNCAFHTNEVAVAQCVDCGRGLCKECSDKYDIAICDACNEKRNANDKYERKNFKKLALSGYFKLMTIGLLCGISVFAFCVYMSYKSGDYNYSKFFPFFIDGLSGNLRTDDDSLLTSFISFFVVNIFFYCIPYGWHTINYFARNKVQIIHPVFIIAVPLIKFMISFIIGWVTLPVYIIKFIIALIKK